MKRNIVLCVVLVVILAAAVCASYLFVFGGAKKNVKTTNTIKIGERDANKLITASQFVDFVTVLISGDRKNEYIEYQTFKVEAGIDLKKDKNVMKIINKPIQLDRTVLRDKLGGEKYDSFIKPIQSAYALKACDIAVNYDILENARNNISENDEALFGIKKDSLEKAELRNVPVNYLPCYFETFGETINDDVRVSLLNSMDLDFRPQGENFSRDSLRINIKGKGRDTYIQIGYTGKTFPDDTFESFKKRLQTENENITLFSYFDPLDDTNSKQVLSYATDSYRTVFVLHQGKLYYIDLNAPDAQTRESLSDFVLYIAMSMKFDDEKEDISDEYIRYLEDFDEALKYLREKQYSEFYATVKDLLDQKENPLAETEEEKMLFAAANYFMKFDEERQSVSKDFDLLFDNASFFRSSRDKEDNFSSADDRNNILREISKNTKTYEKEVRANLLTYFLQNESKFLLSEDEKEKYLSELTERACTVDKTIIESFETDKERNDFYLRLFENAYDNNSDIKGEQYHQDVHPDITFLYTKNAWEILSGSSYLDAKLTERNGGIPLGNAFVFVFSESEFPVLNSSGESDNAFIQTLKDIGKTFDDITKSVHALVFDNCSVRLFVCVDDDSLFEKAASFISSIRKFFTQRHTIKKANQVPEFVYFWDWRKMNIYKNGTAFLGYDFSNTSNFSKDAFRKTERFVEIRTVGEILLQMQNAYENDDFHYELALDFLERQVRNHIYDRLWRPSLNISDAETDKRARYNYLWSD